MVENTIVNCCGFLLDVFSETANTRNKKRKVSKSPVQRPRNVSSDIV